MIISGIKDLIISGGDVIAQAVVGGAAVLNLELTAAGGDRKDHLITKLQAAIATVLVGNIPDAVHVCTVMTRAFLDFSEFLSSISTFFHI